MLIHKSTSDSISSAALLLNSGLSLINQRKVYVYQGLFSCHILLKIFKGRVKVGRNFDLSFGAASLSSFGGRGYLT